MSSRGVPVRRSFSEGGGAPRATKNADRMPKPSGNTQVIIGTDRSRLSAFLLYSGRPSAFAEATADRHSRQASARLLLRAPDSYRLSRPRLPAVAPRREGEQAHEPRARAPEPASPEPAREPADYVNIPFTVAPALARPRAVNVPPATISEAAWRNPVQAARARRRRR